MRAVWLSEFGAPVALVPGEAADPKPGVGQALVEVAFANITFVETQMRAGTGPFPVRLPMIPGNGVGGVIAEVGPGVSADLIGRRVVSGTGGSGGYAELAVVDASALIPVPDGLALDAAVALLADGRTAAMLVDAAELRPRDRVLVEAAGGGVGTLLVQLARAAGATVVAAAGDARKLTLAQELGAHALVNYREADWTRWIRKTTGRLDVVLDGVGGDIARRAFDLLDPGGRMLSYGLASGEWASISEDEADARGVRLVRTQATPERQRSFTRQVLAEAAAGRLRPVIGQRFPLADAARAHAAIESRTTVGKTLLVAAAS